MSADIRTSSRAGRGPVRRGAWVLLDADKADRVVRTPSLAHPHLVVPLGDGRSLVTVLQPGARLTIGRAQDADLPLSWDVTVSSAHAVVERHLDLVTLDDLGPSRNGTYVNGTRITARTRLEDRDIVRCAKTELLVRCPVVEEGRGTVAMAPPIEWRVLSPTERRVVLTLLELWPLELRLQRAPSTASLGAQLELAESTVKTHLQSIFRKLAAFGVAPDRTSLADAATGHERAIIDAGSR